MSNTFGIRCMQFFTAGSILFCLAACEVKNNTSTNSIQSTVVIDAVEAAHQLNTENQHQTSKNSLDQKHTHLKQVHPKPGAAVSLKNSQPLYAANPGVYDYQLQLISPSKTGTITVVTSASDGVMIVSPEREVAFQLQEFGEYVLPLTVNASTEGRFYIQLQVTISEGEHSSKRAIAAILQVGEPVIKAQKAEGRSSAVDGVISLPAQETISPR